MKTDKTEPTFTAVMKAIEGKKAEELETITKDFTSALASEEDSPGCACHGACQLANA